MMSILSVSTINVLIIFSGGFFVCLRLICNCLGCFEHSISLTLSSSFCGFAVYTMSSGGDPAYLRGYPTGGGGAASSESSFNAGELSASLSSSGGTSGIASGEGTDCSGGGLALQQRLGVGVGREQGVRDLRSIIQCVFS